MRQFFVRSFLIVLITTLVSLVGVKAYDKWVDGFYLKNIFITTPYDPSWEISYPAAEQEAVARILDQPFYYFAKGRQCYAFISADGKYILKFLKCQRVKTYDIGNVVAYLPQFFQQWRQNKQRERQERLHKLFTSYWLAKKELEQESGVFYVHLNPVRCINKPVKLYNKIGVEYQLDINQVPFALQKKAEMVLPTLEQLLDEGHELDVQKRLDQIIAIIVSRVHKGISDIDGSWIIRNNVGFLETTAIHVDIGTFARSTEGNSKDDLQRDLKRLQPLLEWLHRKNPVLETYLQKKIDETIANF